jgi:hypothetical protein
MKIDNAELEHFKRLQREIRDTQTKFNGFMEYLTAKYQIAPGSGLTQEGEIVPHLQAVPRVVEPEVEGE